MTPATPFQLPGIGSTVVFLVLIAIIVMVFVLAHLKSAPDQAGTRLRNVSLFSAGWLALTGALPLVKIAGPQLAITLQTLGFAAMLFVVVGAALSPYGRRMAIGLPLVFLAGVHVFRLPLELVLHQWWQDGFLPIQMTYLGRNFDIVIGVLAIPVGLMAWRWPRLTWPQWLFHILGLVMLARIIIIVNRSNPTPLRDLLGGYETGPDVVLGLHFPYVWIASVAVSAAMFFHVAALRKLRLLQRPEHQNGGN